MPKQVSTVTGIIMIIIAAVIAVGGVLYVMQSSKIKAQIDNVKSQNETAVTDQCKNIIDQNQKNVCYRNFAISSRDIFVCDKIVDKDYPTGKTQYKEDCLVKVKVATGQCEGLDANNGGDRCYIELAVKNNNVSICDKVNDSDFKKECINRISK